jgi:hypothetical protein
VEELGGQPGGLEVGQLRRQVRLGSQAVYRVCAVEDSHVDVEVIDAPGLEPGQRFRFTRDALLEMEILDEAEGHAP